MSRWFFLCLALAAAVLAAGCDRSAPPRGEPDARYTVRGRVEQVPEPSRPLSEFVVKHEPIDEFVNPDGSRGMDTMLMPFPLAKGVSLAGLSPGDAVEIEFVVWTKPGSRGYEVRRIRKLPDGTALRFGKARPLPAPHAEDPPTR